MPMQDFYGEQYEFKIIICPNDDFRNKIVDTWRECCELLKISAAPYNPVEVLVMNFTSFQSVQDRLLRRIHFIAMGSKPFKIGFRDFQPVPAHSIYFKASEKNAFSEFVKKVSKETQPLLSIPGKDDPYFANEPIIYLATRLLPWQFEKGSHIYSNSSFQGAFMADQILLMRRKKDETRYTALQSFSLMGLETATQTNLFL